MITAEEGDLGPALDLQTLEWDDDASVRRISGGDKDIPSVEAILGRPLGWWGGERPGGRDSDRWILLRFAVSYQIDRGCEVEWARLSVDLHPGSDGDQAIAAEQYPEGEVDEERRDVNLSISPQLKLSELSVGLGSAATTIHIDRIIPVVSSWGGQERSFGWDLTMTDRHPISGVRHFFAVALDSTRTQSVSMSIEADVRSPDGFLRRGRPSKETQERQFDVLWQSWD
jgi:hypothetical protein